MKKPFTFVVFLCILTHGFAQKYTLSGYVKEQYSQELLLGTTVYVPKLQIGTTANAYGFYSITLPQGNYDIEFSFVGYQTQKITIELNKNLSKNIILVPGEEINEVVVSAEKIKRESDDVRTSVIAMPIKQIKEIPTLLGEKDVLKLIQLMPGVQKGTEGQSGIYVRGGGPDQNLLILDDAPVYNAQHLFGFFSVFNGDALRSVELIKGGFPAKYGGRLSSVIDMHMKDGNKEHYTGEVGIGLLSSRLVVEGPIAKDKASFLVSGRRTYIDVLTAPIVASQNNGGLAGYYFYDLNAKLNYDVNSKNKLYLSGYFGRDVFYLKEKNSKFNLGWGNQTATFRWNHQFNSKLFANTSLIYSRYRFKIKIEQKNNEDVFSLNYNSGIDDWGAKIDFNFYPTPKHTIQFGIASTYHIFTPKAITHKNTEFPVNDMNQIQKIRSIENGIYVEDYYKPFKKMQIMAGLRYSFYIHKGKNYNMLEPRLSASYKLTNTMAIKASYAKTQQYIHLLSNTGIGLPTDLWIPSTKNIKPQSAWQVAGGIAKDFVDKNISLTIEGYYKEMQDIVGFKPGANFMSNGMDITESRADEVSWEDMIAKGNAKSYGAELLLQRKIGKLTGWIGYTLSWTKHKFPELNFGKEFWAKYDRRHDLSIVAMYKISDKISISSTWVFATGNAFTLATSKYTGVLHQPFPETSSAHNQKELTHFPGRNTFRMAPYHRLDFGIQFSKQKKRGVRTWDISLYNVYFRSNPFFYYVENTDGEGVRVMQKSLFPFMIPSFTYSFKFN